MLYVYQLMYISQNSAHTLWVEIENVKRCALYEGSELPVFCPCCQVGGGVGGGCGYMKGKTKWSWKSIYSYQILQICRSV